ncbi:MAG: YegS/Rv2252/BmrU family lipid kinase [Bacilli bacterium]|nr:YegS/Rv2252/BmrU family lipid kinase [Bacilli bacterium]
MLKYLGMKVLYLYSDKTGIAKSERKINKLNNKLREIYPDITIKKTKDLEDFENSIKESVGVYDALIVAGGDGTVKLVVTILMAFPKEKRPILGYIPTGTVNDAGKAVGIKGSVRQALKVLKAGNIDDVDICKVNNEYFTFVCAAGAFSDISYVVKRGYKKVIGRLAYYFYALSQIFKRRIIECEIETKNEKFSVKTPFIMVMNSRNVGGFPVNFDFSVKDGLVEVYITKPGLFNGLLHYAFFKVKTTKLKVDYIKITLKNDEYWCFDGERGDKKSVEISVLKQELKVIGKAQK